MVIRRSESVVVTVAPPCRAGAQVVQQPPASVGFGHPTEGGVAGLDGRRIAGSRPTLTVVRQVGRPTPTPRNGLYDASTRQVEGSEWAPVAPTKHFLDHHDGRAWERLP